VVSQLSGREQRYTVAPKMRASATSRSVQSRKPAAQQARNHYQEQNRKQGKNDVQNDEPVRFALERKTEYLSHPAFNVVQ